jgi:hypothetical protein
MTQIITPDPECTICHGSGIVTDIHPWGSTYAREESFCNCVIEQANDDENDEIEILLHPKVVAENMAYEECLNAMALERGDE